MAFKGKTPETGSKQWQRNEKIINETPVLRRARDVSQGFSGTRVGNTSGWTPSAEYKNNYDQIFGKRTSKQEDNND